jgi:hypothetical protein
LTPPQFPGFTKKFRIGLKWVEKGLPMSFGIIRLSILSGVVILIAGCNDSPNVGSSSSSPTTVTYSFTGAMPTTVAARIGSGSFAAATLTSGQLSLQIPAGTTNFAVAFVCPPVTEYIGGTGSTTIFFNMGAISSNHAARTSRLRSHQIAGVGTLKAQDIADGIYTSTTEEVFAASTLDGTSFTTSCSGSIGNTASNLGTATGEFDLSALGEFVQLDIVGINESSGVSWYTQDITGVGGVSTKGFSAGFPTGNDRVILVVSGVGSNGATFNAIKSLNDQAVPGALNNGKPIVFDTSDIVTYQPITYKNLPAGCTTPAIQASFVPSGTQDQIVIGGINGQFPVAPASALENGDYYFIQSDTGPCNTAIFVGMTTSSGGPITINFPAPWSYAGPNAAALPTFPNLDYSGFAGKGTQAVELDWFWGSPSGDISDYNFIATRNSMGGASSLTFPDLSSVPGFLTLPPSGQEVNWDAVLVQSSYGIQPVTANGTVITAGSVAWPVTANGTISSVGSAGSYVVP